MIFSARSFLYAIALGLNGEDLTCAIPTLIFDINRNL